jgi:hypothetical protein
MFRIGRSWARLCEGLCRRELLRVGGSPHQDLWDLKPDAPVEVRGEFKPIATGRAIGELFA